MGGYPPCVSVPLKHASRLAKLSILFSRLTRMHCCAFGNLGFALLKHPYFEYCPSSCRFLVLHKTLEMLQRFKHFSADGPTLYPAAVAAAAAKMSEEAMSWHSPGAASILFVLFFLSLK